jgi:hypothetical protein
MSIICGLLLGAILPGIGCVTKLEHVGSSHKASEEGRKYEEATEVQKPTGDRNDNRAYQQYYARGVPKFSAHVM